MTTEGCHLCEQAWTMIDYLLENDPEVSQLYKFNKVEISDEEELVELFGIRIPVLVSSKGELGWPFEFEEMVTWLKG